jgi:hypothetical protein
MSTFTPRSEKFLVAGLSAFLAASIVGVAACMLALGSNWLRPAAPVLRWYTVLFANAVFLFVIGWTDFPEQIRRSTGMRSQVQCWTVWQALLALPVLMTLEQVNIIVVFSVMFGAAVALVAYSAGSAYRALRA